MKHNKGERQADQRGGSRDPYLGRRGTRPDYAAYCRWCEQHGIRPLAEEPLAYGECLVDEDLLGPTFSSGQNK